MAGPSQHSKARGVLANRRRNWGYATGLARVDGIGSQPAVEDWLAPWTGPVVVSTTVTTQASFSGTHIYQLPTVAVGDRLIMVSGYLGSLAEYTPTTDLSAWTSFLASEINAFQAWRGYTIYIADAAAVTAWSGATVTFNGANGGKLTCVVYRVAYGDSGGLNVGFDHSGPSANASNTLPDPPELVVDWGTDQNLWITFACFGSGGDTAIRPPNAYESLVQGGAAADQVTIAGSHRYKTDVGENPGSFVLSGAENNQGLTFAVRPLQPAAALPTPSPHVVGEARRRLRSRARALLARNLAEPPAPATTTPDPLVVRTRATRARGRSILLRSPSRSASTPDPIVVARRPARRAPSFAFERNPATFTPIATPKPLVVSRRPRRRPVLPSLLRSPNRATPVATPEPVVVTRRPWRRPRPTLLVRNPAEPPTPAVATPDPIVYRAPLLRRWRPAPIVVRNPDRVTPIATPDPLVVSRRPKRSLGRVVSFRNPAEQVAVVGAGAPRPIVALAKARRGRGRLVSARNPGQSPTTPEPIVIGRRSSRKPRRGTSIVSRGPARVATTPDPIVVSRRPVRRQISETVIITRGRQERRAAKPVTVVSQSRLGRTRRSLARVIQGARALVAAVATDHISVTVEDDSHSLTIRETSHSLTMTDSHSLTIEESYTVEMQDKGHTGTEKDQG